MEQNVLKPLLCFCMDAFVSIPNYGGKPNFRQVALEKKDQVEILPYYGVWILDANFGSRWGSYKIYTRRIT
jgi:hypothetical protein